MGIFVKKKEGMHVNYHIIALYAMHTQNERQGASFRNGQQKEFQLMSFQELRGKENKTKRINGLEGFLKFLLVTKGTPLKENLSYEYQALFNFVYE